MKPIIHSPPNTADITELFAYLSIDKTGEGIAGGIIEGRPLPLVTASAKLANGLYAEMAAEIQRLTGKPVRLVKVRRVTD